MRSKEVMMISGQCETDSDRLSRSQYQNIAVRYSVSWGDFIVSALVYDIHSEQPLLS